VRAGVESETSAAKRQVARLRDSVEVLQEERARYARHVEEARAALRAASERIKEETAQGEVASARLAELEMKVRQQKHLFEAMRAERNAYAKSVVSAEADIGAMRRRFQTLTFEIEQSKDEVMALNQVLVREHFALQKLRKETERWTGELATVQKQVQSSEHILAAQSKEVGKLRAIVGEAETERDRQTKELATVLSERDVLNAQLVARDRELEQVYERLRAQKAALVRGAEQYERRRAEVDAAEALIADLQAEVKLAEAQVGNVDQLGREAKRLRESLDRERSKAARLMQELARPINVHRWRGLQISDPERFRLIQRVAALQKRLVASQADLEAKDAAIAERERLYAQLKEALARQPGAGEVGEQIRSYEANLKHKRKQLAALRSELDTYKQLVDEHSRGVARALAATRRLEEQWVKAVLHRHKAAERQQRALERDALLANLGLAYRPSTEDQELDDDQGVGAALSAVRHSPPPTEHKDDLEDDTAE
jgi:chromosome segregation ATPase